MTISHLKTKVFVTDDVEFLHLILHKYTPRLAVRLESSVRGCFQVFIVLHGNTESMVFQIRFVVIFFPLLYTFVVIKSRLFFNKNFSFIHSSILYLWHQM